MRQGMRRQRRNGDGGQPSQGGDGKQDPVHAGFYPGPARRAITGGFVAQAALSIRLISSAPAML